MCNQQTRCKLTELAGRTLDYYYQRIPFGQPVPLPVNLDFLLELAGGSIKMLPLSTDGSLLGLTVRERLIVRMVMSDGTVIRDTLRPQDIVVDSSLAGFRNTGNRNFTLAHEIGHQILHWYYPAGQWSAEQEEEFADILAVEILLPERLVRETAKFFQFPDTLAYASHSYLDDNYHRFKAMARYLGVTRQILADRMRELNILTDDVPYRHSLPLLEGAPK